MDSHGDVYVVNGYNSEVQEIAAWSHTQFGIAMTAGDVYTVAGSSTGVDGDSGNGGAARRRCWIIRSVPRSTPRATCISRAGRTTRCERSRRRQAISPQWPEAHAGTAGYSGDGGAATSAPARLPDGREVDSSGDIYIVDQGNNRIQEVAGVNGTQHGVSMTKGDIYTIAGSSSGTAGYSGIGGAAASADLEDLWSVALDSSGDLYLSAADNADVNDEGEGGGAVLEIPAASGASTGYR